MNKIYINYLKLVRLLPIVVFLFCFNFTSFALPATGSWLGVGNVNLSIITDDLNNTDGVGDGAIKVDGQTSVVGQGIIFQFNTPMINAENLTFNTYVYNTQSSFVKYRVQLYNANDNSILAQTAEITIINSSSAPVNSTLTYKTVASDVGDFLQIRYLRTDDGNTARDFAIDNAKLNGDYLTENMVNQQIYLMRTYTYNPTSSFVRFDVQLYNATDSVVLATKEVYHGGGDATPVNTYLVYSASNADNGDVLQLRYVRKDDGNAARGFAVDNASLNGDFMRNLGDGNCPTVVNPDLPLLPSSPSINAEINLILSKYSDDILGTSAPTVTNLNTAIASYNSYNIVVNGNFITGKTISKWTELKFLQVFAAELKFNPSNTAVQEMARNIIWLTGRQYCDGTLGLDHNGYEYREFGRGAIFLKSILTPKIIGLFEHTMYDRQKKYIDFWLTNYNQSYILANDAIDTDWIFNLSDILMGYVAWQNTDDEKYRYMVAIKRYMDRFFTTSPGTSNGIKVDGTGFHHSAAYNGYMYAYNTAVDITYYLDNTQFQIDLNSYKVIKDAVIAQHAMANDSRLQAISTSGRNPQIRQNETNKRSLKRLAIVGGNILGLSTADPSVAGLYNRIYGTDSELNYTTVAPVSEGFTQFNHMNAGAYKKDNWLAFVKGFSNNSWGSEAYINQNRYGRYQSYGALEIIYPGSKTDNGYDAFTWDWNFNPGTTVIKLPWSKLHAERERIDELQQKRFVGTLTLEKKNNERLRNIYGQYGVFAMDFQEQTGQGFGATYSTENHNSTFTFKKSNFFFDDIIVCLGSGINNNDNGSPTVTTLFQRLDNNANDVIVNNNSVNTAGITTFSGTNNNWILSNYSTGFYVFSSSSSVIINNTIQQTPNQNQIWPATITGNSTAAYNVSYINHGTSPSNKGYEYIVKPATNAAAMQALDSKISSDDKPYIVHRKNSNAHIVEYLSKDIWAYAIFTSEPNLPFGRIKTINTSCLLMSKYDSVNYTMLLSLNNPDIGFEYRSNAQSISKNVNVTINGEWHLQDTYPNVTLVSSNPTETKLTFTTINGLPNEITLIEGPESCPLGKVGKPCNESNPCTVNDAYDATCNCVGETATETNIVLLPAASNQSGLVEACEINGWTYYRNESATNPADRDKGLFAIRKNGNVATFDVSLGSYTNPASNNVITSLNTSSSPSGSYLMRRYWNVSLTSGSIANGIDIRFFYEPNELEQTRINRDADISTYGGTAESYPEWFKTNAASGGFSPSLITSQTDGNDWSFASQSLTSVSNIDSVLTDNGYVTYVQFDGLTSLSGGTGGTSFGENSVLPIELVSFSASVQLSAIILDWRTASEFNNDRFEILRSEDAISFTKIGEIKGNGTSSNVHNYSFVDENIESNKMYYYKLVQIDFDGTSDQSNIVSAIINSNNVLIVGELVPNPARNFSTIEIISPSSAEFKIAITNMMGQNIELMDYLVVPGSQKIMLNTNRLSEGNYIITLQSNDGFVTQRKLQVIK